jgi:hypothetical protein
MKSSFYFVFGVVAANRRNFLLNNLNLVFRIKHLSPVTWTHINFQGKYEFLSTQETIDIDAWLDRILISEDVLALVDL